MWKTGLPGTPSALKQNNGLKSGISSHALGEVSPPKNTLGYTQKFQVLFKTWVTSFWNPSLICCFQDFVT
jgi:hypothetical protein